MKTPHRSPAPSVLERAVAALASARCYDPAAWNRLAVWLDPTRDRVLPRGQLTAELRAGDLGELARSTEGAHIPPGSIVVLHVPGDDEAAAPAVGVLPLRARVALRGRR